MQYIHKRIIPFLRFFLNKFLPLFFWLFLLLGFDAPFVAILTILCAAIHELGHVVAILLSSRKVKIPTPVLSGLRIKEDFRPSYKTQIFIYISGPLFNLFAFSLCLFFNNSYMRFFAILNLLSALSNLLPLENYDGYNILNELAQFFEKPHLTRLLNYLSFSITAIFTLLSLKFMLNYSLGYWTFALFFISLMLKIKKVANSDVF